MAWDQVDIEITKSNLEKLDSARINKFADRLTKRTPNGIAYMAIADTLPKRDQELEGSKPILEGLYAMFQKLADYEDRDAPQKPKEHYHWGDFSEEEKLQNNRWFCNCGGEIEECDNYCSMCGQKIAWF